MREHTITSTGEHWRPVVGYEGSYAVSDQGRVRSMGRRVSLGGKGGSSRFSRGRVLRAHQNCKGYLRVGLSVYGKERTREVHQLVAEAFIGPRPAGFVTDHIDRNPSNNHFENLRYLANGENRWRDYREERHNTAKLTEKDVWEIRRRLSVGGETQREIGLNFRVSQPTISCIASRKSWAYLS